MASHVDATGHIPRSSGGGLAELLYFSLIFGDAGPRRKRSSAQMEMSVTIPKQTSAVALRTSAYSPKRTCRDRHGLSALGGEADIGSSRNDVGS